MLNILVDKLVSVVFIVSKYSSWQLHINYGNNERQFDSTIFVKFSIKICQRSSRTLLLPLKNEDGTDQIGHGTISDLQMSIRMGWFHDPKEDKFENKKKNCMKIVVSQDQQLMECFFPPHTNKKPSTKGRRKQNKNCNISLLYLIYRHYL